MTIHANTRDLTHRVTGPLPTPQPTLLFMCHHKGLRQGSLMRGNIPWRCPACVRRDALDELQAIDRELSL